jgi:plasmid rolling circle replication initiator protein Rep
MDLYKFQDSLIDRSGSGRIRPWKFKKINNIFLSEVYQGIDEKKSLRLRECATYLEFCVSQSEKMSLKSGNFCRVRLCPMCTWRRSLKIYSQVSKIMNGIQSVGTYRYLFLTLTVRNCVGEDLSSVLDGLFYAWNKFSKFKRFRNVVRGWYRGLEVTHNLSMNTFHPHFHCVLVVDRSYFAWKNYTPHGIWTDLWKKALGVEYTPIVNIKKTYDVQAKSIAEMAKYTVKDTDYIKPWDWELTVEIVRVLDKVLNHRRLVAFGGLFKEWHKKLNLDDVVDGDLVHVDSECAEINENAPVLGYEWNVGYQQYRMINGS